MEDKLIAILLTLIVSTIIAVAWVLMEDNYKKNKEEFDKSDWF